MIFKILGLVTLSLVLLHSVNCEDYSYDELLEEVDYFYSEFPGEVFVPPRQNKLTEKKSGSGNYKAANANQFLDMMLKNAEKTIIENELDPLSLPDAEKKVTSRLLVLVVEGGYSSTNGELHGLSTIHRAGNSTLENKGNSMEVVATLAVRNMRFETDARVWLTAVDIPWRMSATIPYLKATITVVIPLIKTNGEKAEATSLVINEISSINMKFKNLGPLNWLLDGFGTLLTNLLKKVIKNQIQKPMLKAINSAIGTFPGMG